MSLGPLLRTLRYLRPGQILWRIWYRLRLPLFQTRFYAGRLYQGRSEALLATPPARPGDPERGRAILAGRLVLLAQEIALDESFDWHPADRSALWRFTLHYFEWLSDLAALGDEARDHARAMVADWLSTHARPDPEAWHPYPLSLRLYAWLAHADFLLTGADETFKADFLGSLHAQARHLARVVEHDVGGNHIVKNLKALIAAGHCLPGHAASGGRAGRLLRREVGRQVLADGAHYERSPSYHLQVLIDLTEIAEMLAPPPAWLADACDRMEAALAFYRHGDGMLALFNDGTTGELSLVEALADGATAPDALAEAGYHRLSQGRLLVLFDAGLCCPDDLPAHAHADTLSFEFSDGPQRLIVNGGTFAYQDPVWRNRLRSTAAHSTVTVDGLDSAEIHGTFRLGRRPRRIPVARQDNRITAAHDGYRHLGVTHERRLELSPGGLSGDDALSGPGLPGRRITARFHLHPTIRALQSDGEIRLHAADGAEWTFRAEGGAIGLAPSVYCPDFNVMLATQAIVCEAHAASNTLSLAWSFTRST